jgi:hypothetical protein
MSNCPHCAEPYGLRQIIRRENCGHCRLPLEIDSGGRIATYAAKHARRILAAPKGLSYWLLFGLGIAATITLSVIPSFGVLVPLILAPLQAFSLERSIHRYQEHFGLLHTLTVDFYATFLFLFLLLVQGVSGLLLESASVVLNLPLFLLVWWAYGRYAEWHFRQVARRQPPSVIELGIIGLTVASVVAVPFVFLIAVIVSYALG